jgi:2'-5' RNA ligase
MQRISRSLDSIFADIVDVVDPDSTVDEGAEVHTGAMVALLPSQKYKELLAIPGEEPPEELHVTILYLGKAADWEENAGVDKEHLIEVVQNIFSGFPEINAEINAHAVFNPDSDEPASVYLIGGEGAVTCRKLHEMVSEEANSDHYSVEVPHDFPFYLPHMTIGYDCDVEKLSYSGPITFDTARIVFAGDMTDIPLRKG